MTNSPTTTVTTSDSEDDSHFPSPTSPPRASLAIISENEDDEESDLDNDQDHLHPASPSSKSRAEWEREKRKEQRGLKTEADVISGYLMKKGERRKVLAISSFALSVDIDAGVQAWKKRYFVLRPKVICYYKNDKVRLSDRPADRVPQK